MDVEVANGARQRCLPSTVSTNFLVSCPSWAERTKVRDWSELQPFVAEYGSLVHWQEIDPRTIVGCFTRRYANKSFADALANPKFEQHRRLVQENPSYLWDTGWELRKFGLIGNWLAYDVDGEIFIDGDGTTRSILARFIAEENNCPPFLVPKYRTVKIDWDAFHAYRRLETTLEDGCVSWCQNPRYVWFQTSFLSRRKVYDVVELSDWIERREAILGWRKYIFFVTRRLKSVQ